MNLLDLIFPKALYCISCGRPLPPSSPSQLLSSPSSPLPPEGAAGIALCERCVGEIVWMRGRRCAKCGRQLADENPAALCRDCASGAAHIFGRAYACALYAGRAAALVRDMKYRDRAYHAETLAAFMAARYFAEADPGTGELPYYDFVIAAPMSAKKKAKRGFDQAALLARGLARRICVPYAADALVRTHDTDVMSSLSGVGRRQNLRGAFTLGCDMIKMAEGKRFLLTDDVYTTGSTVDACAEALLEAGAAGVDVIVFATGADVRRAEDRPAVVESPGQLRAKGPT